MEVPSGKKRRQRSSRIWMYEGGGGGELWLNFPARQVSQSVVPRMHLQGDPSGCSIGSVDIKSQVGF